MRRTTCFWIGGTAIFALGVILLAVNTGNAGPDKEEQKKQKKVNAVIDKIKEAVKKSDQKTLTELVAKLSKAQMKEDYPLARVMKPLALRGTGGYGIGGTANAVTPDGAWLWLKKHTLAAPRKSVLTNNKKDLIEMAWLTRAIAEVTLKTVAPDPNNAANRKLWLDTAKAMQQRSMELVKTFSNPKVDVTAAKNAITKLNDTCDKCHAEFK